MGPVTAFIALLGGLAVLVIAADFLVKGAARLARLLGMSPFAIGVTVVAFGTSAPELFASLGFVSKGESAAAVGNVIGSNIANVLLILGATALLRPVVVERLVVRIEVPVMFVISLIAGSMTLGGTVTRVEGVVLVSMLVVYVWWSYMTGRTDPELRAEAEAASGIKKDTPDGEAPAPPKRSRWMLDVVYVIAGFIGLTLGSELLVRGASVIATDVLGVPAEIVTLTVVAFGTSLPELAASIRAAAASESDIAVGNIVGSNVFNLLCVMGISAMVSPLETPGEAFWAVPVMVISALACLPLVGGRFIGRPQGAVMLVSYLVYAGVLFREPLRALLA